jgi:hypothetical protein
VLNKVRNKDKTKHKGRNKEKKERNYKMLTALGSTEKGTGLIRLSSQSLVEALCVQVTTVSSVAETSLLTVTARECH